MPRPYDRYLFYSGAQCARLIVSPSPGRLLRLSAPLGRLERASALLELPEGLMERAQALLERPPWGIWNRAYGSIWNARKRIWNAPRALTHLLSQRLGR